MAVRLVASADEVLEFLERVQEAIDRPPPEWLYLMNPGRDGLPISFDRDWYPFLGKRYGYNEPNERRYLPDGIRLIERIKPILETDSILAGDAIPGGRCFFGSTGVVRISRSMQRRQVVIWQWPEVKFP